MTYNEKRVYTRHTVRDDVTLMVFGKSEEELCVLEDVSMNGTKFFSEQDLPIGSRVELRIPSSSDEPDIVIKAEVLRQGPGDYNKAFGYGCMIEES